MPRISQNARPPASPRALPAAADLAGEARNWLVHLSDERRVSPHTAEAYARDLRQFLQFLTDHFGEAPSLASLRELTGADFRAFLASRRREDIGSRSLLRSLAGIRSFARFLERQGKGKLGMFAAGGAPKIPPSPPQTPSARRARGP